MSAKRPELSAELLTRVLPALRMLARFPSRPAKVVSFETGIELTDIYAYTERRGRPNAAHLERIQHDLQRLADGETLTEDEAGAPPAPAVAEAAPKPAASTPKPEKLVPPTKPAFSPPPSDQPWLNRRLQGKAMRLYVPVLAWMLANPRAGQRDACRACSVDDGCFSAWRIGVFGNDLPDGPKLGAFVQWGNEQLRRRREPLIECAVSALPSSTTASSLSQTISATTVTNGLAKTIAPPELDRMGPPETPRYSARNERHDELVELLLAAAQACNAAALALLKGGAS